MRPETLLQSRNVCVALNVALRHQMHRGTPRESVACALPRGGTIHAAQMILLQITLRSSTFDATKRAAGTIVRTSDVLRH